VLGWAVTSAFLADHLELSTTGTPLAWNSVYQDAWTPVFYRSITSIDTLAHGYRIHLDVPLRSPALTRDNAMVYREFGYLSESGVEHLSLSNTVPWTDAWATDQRVLLDFAHVKNCWALDVHSFASPWSALDATARGHHVQSCGIEVGASRLVTIDSCDFENAENRGGGGNGYLYWISLSNEVLVHDSAGINGRHNFTCGGTGFAGSGNVFLRVTSKGALGQNSATGSTYQSFSDFHNYLQTANLIDDSTLVDGWIAPHQGGDFGQTSTQSVFWNDRGGGLLASYQFDWGYVVGVNDLSLHTALSDPVTNSIGFLSGDQVDFTAPEDLVECGGGATVDPPSLYEDQLARRHGLVP
jgi:hypothetical protein